MLNRAGVKGESLMKFKNKISLNFSVKVSLKPRTLPNEDLAGLTPGTCAVALIFMPFDPFNGRKKRALFRASRGPFGSSVFLKKW